MEEAEHTPGQTHTLLPTVYVLAPLSVLDSMALTT